MKKHPTIELTVEEVSMLLTWAAAHPPRDDDPADFKRLFHKAMTAHDLENGKVTFSGALIRVVKS